VARHWRATPKFLGAPISIPNPVPNHSQSLWAKHSEEKKIPWHDP
jgi:hypothetical protein